MSIADAKELPGIREQSAKLRLDLKEWEKSFAAANEGRKAGRDDIKQHPTIGTEDLFRQY